MDTRINEFQTIFSRHLYLRCTCDSFCFFPNKYGLFSEFLNCFLFLKWSKSNKIFFSLVTLSRCENMKMTFMSLRKNIYIISNFRLIDERQSFCPRLFFILKKKVVKRKSQRAVILLRSSFWLHL